jgi:hypothetical protein
VKFYYVDFLHFDIDFLFVFMLKCAASMSVGGGYFSDPVGFEGVSHFLGVHCF